MKKFFSNVFTTIKAKVSHARNRAKLMMMGAAIAALTPIGASAQNLAGTGYDAGTSALEDKKINRETRNKVRPLWPVLAMMQELPHWRRSHPSWSSTFRM